jgi:hypothetical protein
MPTWAENASTENTETFVAAPDRAFALTGDFLTEERRCVYQPGVSRNRPEPMGLSVVPSTGTGPLFSFKMDSSNRMEPCFASEQECNQQQGGAANYRVSRDLIQPSLW